MFNLLILLLKNKLTTGWSHKWYYWGYLNLILSISFLIFCYCLWLLYPTNIINVVLYVLFFWLGLILTPIYWCWLWIIFILHMFGLKIPFLLYPLGMGLVGCRLGILILYGYIILIPFKFLGFKLHQYLYNFLIESLLFIVSFYQQVKRYQKNFIFYKKLLFQIKKNIKQFFLYYIFKFQDTFPQYVLIYYIRIYKFIHKYHILILFWYLILRFFYFCKLKILIFLYITRIKIYSNKYYLKYISNNILIIQKTQRDTPEIELIIMNKKFLKIFNQLNLKPRLVMINKNYLLHKKYQKFYEKN